MLRLVFEAVMVIAVVSCLFFMIKLGETGNKPEESSPDKEGDGDSH